jgi:predicted NAD/FAD-binding protein
MSTTPTPKQKVAVIGGGVSGLSAAWHLHTNASASASTSGASTSGASTSTSTSTSQQYDVHLFEAEDRLGGHAHTVSVPDTGINTNTNTGSTTTANNNNNNKASIDVDIGFMVFNSGKDGNYPNMTAWFAEMGIEEEDSDMSLSVSLDGGKSVEWSSDGINGLFANRAQLFRPSFYTYINDMVRFNAEAADLLLLPENDPRRVVTTGQYLRDHGYSNAFCTHYLLPMMAALWSASMEDVLQFPAAQLIGFLANHKMLQLFERPQVCMYVCGCMCVDVCVWMLMYVCGCVLMLMLIVVIMSHPYIYLSPFTNQPS